MNQICILGGGASGMAAAITIARNRPDIPVVILEKNPFLGKKILASGNGRCNITNSATTGEELVIDFLNNVGIFTRQEENGRVYPFSGRAEDVAHLLRTSLDLLGVKVVTNFYVKEVVIQASGFLIRGHYCKEDKVDNAAIKEFECSKLVLALGGKAAPQFGTIGEGYIIAKTLGIPVTRTFPGLTWIQPLRDVIDLQGIRVKGNVCLFRNGQLIAEEKGEIQFTKVGLSGICIFNLSSQVVLGNAYSFKDYEISIDFMAEKSINQVRALVKERSEILGMTVANLLRSIIPSPLEKEILNFAGVSLSTLDSPAKSLKDSTLFRISDCLKGLHYPIKGIGGWKDAQITVGGVSLESVDQKTWESHTIPGLYIIGELLDRQGPCGGYNLHNAWKTGIEAGNALGK